jgi:hypothetical protein
MQRVGVWRATERKVALSFSLQGGSYTSAKTPNTAELRYRDYRTAGKLEGGAESAQHRRHRSCH